MDDKESNTKISKSPGLTAEEVSDFLYLCNPAKREVFVLNQYAGALWKQLDSYDDLTELSEALQAKFEDASGSLRHDIVLFVAALEARGLVQTTTRESQDV